MRDNDEWPKENIQRQNPAGKVETPIFQHLYKRSEGQKI